MMLHMVEKCATNWHDPLFAPLFKQAAGLTKVPLKLHVRTNKMLQEILNAAWIEIREVALPALQKVNRFDSRALINFFENDCALGCILYESLLKNGRSKDYFDGLTYGLVSATKSCRFNYMTNLYRMMDQKLYLEHVNHDAKCFVNDQAIAANDESFGEGHYNLVTARYVNIHSKDFEKAKEATIQHFLNDMTGDVSNFYPESITSGASTTRNPVSRQN